jgi:hypothetical protein
MKNGDDFVMFPDFINSIQFCLSCQNAQTVLFLTDNDFLGLTDGVESF